MLRRLNTVQGRLWGSDMIHILGVGQCKLGQDRSDSVRIAWETPGHVSKGYDMLGQVRL
jgi:hypothetical protein